MEYISEAEKRKHRCCFTGHRPDKLNVSEKTVVRALEKEIRIAIQGNLPAFLTVFD